MQGFPFMVFSRGPLDLEILNFVKESISEVVLKYLKEQNT